MWADHMVTASLLGCHKRLGRSSRARGPCYPPLGNVYLSPQGVTYCPTSKDHVSRMRRNIFQRVKKKSSYSQEQQPWVFTLLLLYVSSEPRVKSVVSLVCPVSSFMTLLVGHRLTSRAWSCFSRRRACRSCWMCLPKLMLKAAHTVLSCKGLL